MNSYKKNNTIIVIVVAIILLLVSALIYNFYFKDYVEYNKGEEKKESLYVDVTDANVINEILNTIKVNNLDDVAAFEKNIDNINTLEPIEKINIAYNVIKGEKDNTEIDVLELDNYFKNAFKTTIYWDKADIYCVNGEVLYKFDISSNKYIYNIEHNCVIHNEISSVYTKVLSVKKKNNIYVITVNHVWSNALESDIMYSSFANASNKKDMLLVIPSEAGNPSEEDINNFIDGSYDNIKDKLHKYTYTFDKKDDKFLLESFKFN